MKTSYLSALLSIFLFYNLSSQNVILNGSFENSDVDPGADYNILNPGSTVLTNWEIISGTVDHIGGRRVQIFHLAPKNFGGMEKKIMINW